MQFDISERWKGNLHTWTPKEKIIVTFQKRSQLFQRRNHKRHWNRGQNYWNKEMPSHKPSTRRITSASNAGVRITTIWSEKRGDKRAKRERKKSEESQVKVKVKWRVKVREVLNIMQRRSLCVSMFIGPGLCGKFAHSLLLVETYAFVAGFTKLYFNFLNLPVGRRPEQKRWRGKHFIKFKFWIKRKVTREVRKTEYLLIITKKEGDRFDLLPKVNSSCQIRTEYAHAFA